MKQKFTKRKKLLTAVILAISLNALLPCTNLFAQPKVEILQTWFDSNTTPNP